jgi:hypothetical protein
MQFIGNLIDRHLARYPQMALADIYKLLHQAALGSAHAIDALAARSRLQQEIAALRAGPEEPLVDPISPDGRLARIHLRPFVAAGCDPDVLLEAFANTAQTYPASPQKLAKFCACLGELAALGRIPFAREAVLEYVAELEESGYPTVRHSEGYREAYLPAYRVVALEHLPIVE